ncbi:MAG: type II toxin-antitoxin system death-on-curing family toxin [Phycisphaeraceae bacterium]|nr:type II toxin-antitoxin system death-on-curing family toxin [Phycisphaeraceae bacterium]
MDILFLNNQHVLKLHQSLIEHYGGSAGVREMGLMESAIAQPRAMFSGEYLHQWPYEMAAAYLFHLVKNHPFIDGNKRTGAASAIVFLDINGIQIHNDEAGLVDLTLNVATGQADKSDIAAFFKLHHLQ